MTKTDSANLETLKKIQKECAERVESHKNKISFTRGLILGLLTGIIGNIFVQFFYPVYEAMILQTYDLLFWSNVIISVFSLVSILWLTWSFYNDVSWSKSILEEETRNIIDLEKMINEESTKLDNQD